MKLTLLALYVIIVAYTVKVIAHKDSAVNYSAEAKPLLVVVLMVKNEAHVIRQTVQPFVDVGVQHFFVFDTGSDDGTPEVIATYFTEHNILHGHVAQEPFIDYAASRNRALELAEQQFPAAAFMIMLDAEWYLKHPDQLMQFCKDNRDDEHDAFLIRINTPQLDFYLPRLMRPQAHLRFIGAIHEHLEVTTAKKIPFEVCFEVRPSQKGQEATKKRLTRDLDRLLKDYSKDPEDTRAIYFLAQTYVSLGNLLEAYHLFRLCVAKTIMNPETPYWKIEQAYQASYHAGILAEELGATDAAFTWLVAQEHHLQAFAITPCRAEPLMRIAQHYWDEKNMHLCFLFARHASELPYPEHATGLVERDVYIFKRYDLLGACAGNIGRWDISEWATRKALEAEPAKQHLHANLAVILERQRAQKTQAPLNHYEL